MMDLSAGGESVVDGAGSIFGGSGRRLPSFVNDMDSEEALAMYAFLRNLTALAASRLSASTTSAATGSGIGGVPTPELLTLVEQQERRLAAEAGDDGSGADEYLFILPFIVLFGLCGNAVSLITIFHSRLRKIAANQYLIVLTLADSIFLCGVIMVLFKVDFTGYLLCVSVEYVLMSASYVSSWCIAALTIERYLAIAYPLKHVQYGYVSRWKMMCFWVPVPFLLNLVQFVTLTPNHDPTDPDWPNVRKCTVKGGQLQMVVEICDVVLCYMLPCFVVVVLNLLIASKVESAEKCFYKASPPPPPSLQPQSSAIEQQPQQSTPMEERGLLSGVPSTTDLRRTSIPENGVGMTIAQRPFTTAGATAETTNLSNTTSLIINNNNNNKTRRHQHHQQQQQHHYKLPLLGRGGGGSGLYPAAARKNIPLLQARECVESGPPAISAGVAAASSSPEKAAAHHNGSATGSASSSTRILLVVPMVYIVLNTPFYMIRMIDTVALNVFHCKAFSIQGGLNDPLIVFVYNAAHYLYYVNFACDVVVYAFSSANFRRTVVVAWHRLLCPHWAKEQEYLARNSHNNTRTMMVTATINNNNNNNNNSSSNNSNAVDILRSATQRVVKILPSAPRIATRKRASLNNIVIATVEPCGDDGADSASVSTSSSTTLTAAKRRDNTNGGRRETMLTKSRSDEKRRSEEEAKMIVIDTP